MWNPTLFPWSWNIVRDPPHPIGRQCNLLIPFYCQHIFLVYPGVYPWGKLIRSVVYTMKIYEALADAQKGPALPLIFRPKSGLNGCKKILATAPTSPYLTVKMTAPPPPLISRSTSSTLPFKGNFFRKCLTSNVCTPFNNKPFNFNLVIFTFSSNYRLFNKAPF